jgi:hypothetical protein
MSTQIQGETEMNPKLWVWYKSEGSVTDIRGGHVVAWKIDQPQDEQGTPTGPSVTTLDGFADIVVAAALVEQARNNQELVWICPDFDWEEPTLDNLLAIWGDDIVTSAVTNNSSNPTVDPTTLSLDDSTAESASGTGSLREVARQAS